MKVANRVSYVERLWDSMAKAFAASLIANWISGSKQGFTDIEQEIACKELDSKLIEVCNELDANGVVIETIADISFVVRRA